MKCCKNCKWYLYEDTREYQEGKPKDIFCCRNIKTDYYSYPRSFDFSCDDWEAYKVSKHELHEATKRIMDYCQTHTDCNVDCYFHGETGCRLRLYPYEWLEGADD